MDSEKAFSKDTFTTRQGGLRGLMYGLIAAEAYAAACTLYLLLVDPEPNFEVIDGLAKFAASLAISQFLVLPIGPFFGFLIGAVLSEKIFVLTDRGPATVTWLAINTSLFVIVPFHLLAAISNFPFLPFLVVLGLPALILVWVAIYAANKVAILIPKDFPFGTRTIAQLQQAVLKLSFAEGLALLSFIAQAI